jgi:hypothetical protein
MDVERVQHWDSRGHFFAAAAEAMRRILVESARHKLASKQSGSWQSVELAEGNLLGDASPQQVLFLNDAFEDVSEVTLYRGASKRVLRVAGRYVGLERGEPEMSDNANNSNPYKPPIGDTKLNLQPGRYTSYADVPWYRRSDKNSQLALLGLCVCSPLLWFVCVMVLTGDIYYDKQREDGTLETWPLATK